MLRRPFAFGRALSRLSRPSVSAFTWPATSYRTNSLLFNDGRTIEVPKNERSHHQEEQEYSEEFKKRRVVKSQVVAIVIANLIVFIYWQTDNRVVLKSMENRFVCSWTALKEGRFQTPWTSMFSHRAFPHLLVNMATLYFLAPDVAFRLGFGRFFALYSLAGIASSSEQRVTPQQLTLVAIGLGHVVFTNYLPSLNAPPAHQRAIQSYGVIGASGGVVGTSVLYAALWPRRIVWVNFIIPIPAVAMPLVFAAIDIYFMHENDNVSHVGHLSGALATFLWVIAKRGRF